MQHYVMNADLMLGQYNRTLTAGMEVKFDGTNITLPSGESLAVPLFGKAVQSNSNLATLVSQAPAPAPTPKQAASAPVSPFRAAVKPPVSKVVEPTPTLPKFKTEVFEEERAVAVVGQRQLSLKEQEEEANRVNLQRIADARARLDAEVAKVPVEQMGGNRVDTMETTRKVGNGKYGLVTQAQSQGVEFRKLNSSGGARVGPPEDDMYDANRRSDRKATKVTSERSQEEVSMDMDVDGAGLAAQLGDVVIAGKVAPSAATQGVTVSGTQPKGKPGRKPKA